VTWGYKEQGGDSSTVSAKLAGGVVSVSSTGSAFAAIKRDGSVVTWGLVQKKGENSGPWSGQYPKLAGRAVSVSTTAYAFAAIQTDTSVVTWGLNSYGGDSSSVSDKLACGVVSVSSTRKAFAALKKDGSVVTWGKSTDGGDSSSVCLELKTCTTAVTTIPACVKGKGGVRLGYQVAKTRSVGGCIMAGLGEVDSEDECKTACSISGNTFRVIFSKYNPKCSRVQTGQWAHDCRWNTNPWIFSYTVHTRQICLGGGKRKEGKRGEGAPAHASLKVSGSFRVEYTYLPSFMILAIAWHVWQF